MNTFFTIVAKNYMANAIALGNSLIANQKGSDFCIVLADELEDAEQRSRIPFCVIEAKELGIEDYSKMAFMYDVVEFSTAIKPFAFLYLLKEYERVVYMDPDTYVMSGRISSIWDMLQHKDFVLTPHITEMEMGSYSDIETHILGAGVFNLGFLGVKRTNEAKRFVEWWSRRLATDCIRGAGLFVDQKWMNYLPVFCNSYHICRDKGFNVADWNLHERTIKYENRRPVIGGNEIAFWHFSKYKLQEPKDYLITVGIDKLKESDEIDLICSIVDEYKNNLINADYNYWSAQRYEYDRYIDGRTINIMQRRIYRFLAKTGRNDLTDSAFSSNSKYVRFLKDNRLYSQKEKEENRKRRIENGAYRGEANKKTNRFVVWMIKLFIKMSGIERFIEVRKKVINTLDYDNLVGLWKND